MNLDAKSTNKKIKLLKTTGQYFPEEYIPSINRALLITEKFLKMYESIEFVQNSNTDYIIKSVPVTDNQERLNYIANTVKKEFSKDEINKMGTIVDLILKLSNYNKMINLMNTVMTNSENLNDKDNVLKLIEPLMEGQDEKEIKKLKDMYKMMNVLMSTDATKKSKDKKEE